MLYHMGTRNFECYICGNKFFQMEHLKRHLQSIHNLTPNEISNLNLSSSNSTTNSEQNNTQIGQKVNNQEEKEKIYQENLPKSDITTNQIFKVITKCTYKCPKCEQYMSSKLINVNQHIINKHSKELVHFMTNDLSSDRGISWQKTNNFTEETTEKEETSEEEDEDDDDIDESEEEIATVEMEIIKEDSVNVSKEQPNKQNINFYLCAFCYFKTINKSNLLVFFCLT